MKKWIKKSIKTTVLTIVAILMLIIIGGALILYIALTPKRLTPIVENIANEYIDAKLHFSEVDLTIFNTFPRVGVRLKDGLLKSTKKDSTANSDTIVSFKSVEILFNPLKVLFENKIAISRVKLENPTIYAYTDSLGKANWDVFEMQSNDSDTAKFTMTANLDKFELVNGKIVFDDRQSKIFARVKKIDVKLSGNMDKRSNIKMDVKLDTTLIWQNGDLLAQKLNVAVVANAHNDPKIKRLFIDDMCVKLNDLDVDVQGWIGRDSVKMNAMAQTNSLKQILNLIPEKYLSSKRNIDTKGIFKLSLNAYSEIRKSELPIFNVGLEITDGKLKYDGFAYGIDDLDTEINANIDLSGRTQSDLNIKKLDVNGTALKITLNGDVKNLLGNAKLNFNTDVDIDFATLSKTLPFKDSIEIAGELCFNGVLKANLNDIKKLNWYDLNARGELTLENVILINQNVKFSFINDRSKVTLSNTKSGETLISGNIGNINVFKDGHYDVRLKNADIAIQAVRIKDSIVGFKGEVGYKGLSLAMPKDSIIITSAAAKVQVDLSEWLKLKFKTDTLQVDMIRSKAVLDSAHVDAKITLKGKRKMGGMVEFKDLAVNSNLFPLPIVIGSTKLSLQRDVIDLSKVNISVGSSKFQISGSAEGVFRALREPEQIMKIKGVMQSKNIDLNELIYAANNLPFMHADSNINQVDTNSNIDYPLFIIPENINANLTVSIDTLKFADIILNNTKGGIQIANQNFRIRRIITHYEGSQLAFRGLYNSAKIDSTVDLTFAVEAQRIDVKKVTTLFPYLDSLTPIIRSVDGLVDLDLVANTHFQKVMNVDIAKMDASIMITAQKVEIPDNETLTEIAKMLMFKNKKVTKVDSVSMQMTVGKGVVDVFPFILDIDRYKVVLGGKQELVGEMDYHVSVLKSPVPIKFGVNITGNFENFKIGIGKTKYKSLQNAEYKGFINQDYKNKREILFAPLVVKRKKE